MRGTNVHTRVFTLLVKRVFDTMVPPTLADLAAIWPPKGALLQHVPELGIDVAVDDYEEAGLSEGARAMVAALHWLFPRTDPNDRWASSDQARAELGAIFGPRLKWHVRWREPASDAALVRLCTQGLAAHCLEREPDGSYAVDLSFLERYPVRRGFVRYGAKLVLDRVSPSQLVPRSIRWARGTHRPGDAEWEHAKLAFRVSTALAVTVRDHAVKCHFLASNAAVIATRTKLPPAHPVRRLLRPFQFRTPAINAGALATLIPEHAIFHRLFALEWEGLSQLYRDAKADFRLEILPAELARRGLDDLECHAYAEDARGLWRCAHGLATQYLDAVSMRDDPENDPALAAWHAELRRVLPTAEVPPIATRAQLADLLAQLMFVATGYHEQVGGAIGDYLEQLDFVVPTMVDAQRYEDCWPSRQTMIQAYMLGVLTNFAMPKILDDFSSLVEREAQPAVRRWLDDLRRHGHAVDARNARRAQPIRTFHPGDNEISVSI